jgi:RNA 2',3'-cyclic 3'-phosphodiesterase
MSGGARARLFVAVDPPPAVREQLALWARTAAAATPAVAPPTLRLLHPDLLHLTLSFLGSRPVAEITAIGSALGESAAHVGELGVGPPLWLPRARPRSLVVAIHDDAGELAALQVAVTRAISDATAWEPERRRFRAHITVARARGRAERGTDRPGVGISLPPTPQLRFNPESLTLYRSWLSPEGASYEALARHDLPAWA